MAAGLRIANGDGVLARPQVDLRGGDIVACQRRALLSPNQLQLKHHDLLTYYQIITPPRPRTLSVRLSARF